jgi:hypothetical protein
MIKVVRGARRCHALENAESHVFRRAESRPVFSDARSISSPSKALSPSRSVSLAVRLCDRVAHKSTRLPLFIYFRRDNGKSGAQNLRLNRAGSLETGVTVRLDTTKIYWPPLVIGPKRSHSRYREPSRRRCRSVTVCEKFNEPEEECMNSLSK